MKLQHTNIPSSPLINFSFFFTRMCMPALSVYICTPNRTRVTKYLFSVEAFRLTKLGLPPGIILPLSPPLSNSREISYSSCFLWEQDKLDWPHLPTSGNYFLVSVIPYAVKVLFFKIPNPTKSKSLHLIRCVEELAEEFQWQCLTCQKVVHQIDWFYIAQ